VEPEGSLQLHKSFPLVPNLRQANPVNTPPISPRPILILSTQLHLVLHSGLFPFGFPTNNLYAFLFFPISATCPTHPNLLDLTILITLGEEYKSRSASLYSLLQPPVTSSLLVPNTLSLMFSLIVRDRVSHEEKQQKDQKKNSLKLLN
jgi:hypothetical protein